MWPASACVKIDDTGGGVMPMAAMIAHADLATLDVIPEEGLVERARERGGYGPAPRDRNQASCAKGGLTLGKKAI